MRVTTMMYIHRAQLQQKLKSIEHLLSCHNRVAHNFIYFVFSEWRYFPEFCESSAALGHVKVETPRLPPVHLGATLLLQTVRSHGQLFSHANP